LLWVNPVEARPFEGVFDCLLDLVLLVASTEADLELGTPGLFLVTEAGLSGNDFFRFGGASWENPGICEGSQGLDFIDGEMPRDCTGFLATTGRAFDADEGRVGGADTPNVLEGVDDRILGVADLWDDLGAVKEGLEVGVEALEPDLVGVDDLTGGAVDFVEVNVAREVGVEGLEDFIVEGNVCPPDGVEGLDVAGDGPLDEEILLLPLVEEQKLDIDEWCLETTLLLELGSIWILFTCNTRKVYVLSELNQLKNT